MVVRVGTKNEIHNGEEAKEKWERDREGERLSFRVQNNKRKWRRNKTVVKTRAQKVGAFVVTAIRVVSHCGLAIYT
jgi:hypothetical protein